jgi:Ankyrin repeats (many copies)
MGGHAPMEPGTQRDLTPLITAIQQGHWQRVEGLLAAGANVNETNGNGVTALMAAAEKGDIISLNILIGAGANLNAKDNEGKTALQVACGSCDISLRAAGARADANNESRPIDKAPPPSQASSDSTPTQPSANRAPSDFCDEIMRAVSKGRQGRTDLRRLIARCSAYDDGLSILSMARRNAGPPLALDLDAAIKVWQVPRRPGSPSSKTKDAASQIVWRVGKQVPRHLRDEIRQAVKDGSLDRLKQLIEDCKTYDDGCATLSEARSKIPGGRNTPTYSRWYPLLMDLNMAIEAWHPPLTPQKRWWQFWKVQPSVPPQPEPASLRVPADLRAKIINAATDGAGDQNYRKALIEVCIAYDDGLSILSEARRICNSRQHLSHVYLFSKELDEAIKAWQSLRDNSQRRTDEPHQVTGKFRLQKNGANGVLRDDFGVIRGLWFLDRRAASDPGKVEGASKVLEAMGERIDRDDSEFLTYSYVAERGLSVEPLEGGYCVWFPSASGASAPLDGDAVPDIRLARSAFDRQMQRIRPKFENDPASATVLVNISKAFDRSAIEVGEKVALAKTGKDSLFSVSYADLRPCGRISPGS